MRNKYLYVIFFIIFIALLVMPINVFATEGTWIDEGNYDYNWYVNDEDFLTENGDGCYYISNAKELAGLCAIANGIEEVDLTKLKNKTIIINHDIDLSEHYWIPISYLENMTIDGNLNHIHGMNIQNGEYVGLIGSIYKVTVEKIFLDGEIDISSKCDYVGGLVGKANDCTIKNIESNVDISLITEGNEFVKVGRNCRRPI